MVRNVEKDKREDNTNKICKDDESWLGRILKNNCFLENIVETLTK